MRSFQGWIAPVGLALTLTCSGLYAADQPAASPASTPPPAVTATPATPTLPPLAPVAVAPAVECGPNCAASPGGAALPAPQMIGGFVSGPYYGVGLIPRAAPEGPLPTARIPHLGRGSFAIAENESPRPQDRIFATYNYVNSVGIFSTTGTPLAHADLHREVIGFEKAYFDDRVSFGLRAPLLQTRGAGLSDSDFGDLTLIGKLALLNNRTTGDVVSIGVAVTTANGPDASLPDDPTFHTTLVQPFVGYLWNFERLYLHGFSAIIIPSDAKDVTLLTNDIGLGYRLLGGDDGGRWITSLTPTIEAHVATPLTHRGLSNGQVIGFPDLFVLTSGVHIGLGSRSTLSTGFAVPLSGPRIFDYGVMAQLNINF